MILKIDKILQYLEDITFNGVEKATLILLKKAVQENHIPMIILYLKKLNKIGENIPTDLKKEIEDFYTRLEKEEEKKAEEKLEYLPQTLSLDQEEVNKEGKFEGCGVADLRYLSNFMVLKDNLKEKEEDKKKEDKNRGVKTTKTTEISIILSLLEDFISFLKEKNIINYILELLKVTLKKINNDIKEEKKAEEKLEYLPQTLSLDQEEVNKEGKFEGCGVADLRYLSNFMVLKDNLKEKEEDKKKEEDKNKGEKTTKTKETSIILSLLEDFISFLKEKNIINYILELLKITLEKINNDIKEESSKVENPFDDNSFINFKGLYNNQDFDFDIFSKKNILEESIRDIEKARNIDEIEKLYKDKPDNVEEKEIKSEEKKPIDTSNPQYPLKMDKDSPIPFRKVKIHPKKRQINKPIKLTYDLKYLFNNKRYRKYRIILNKATDLILRNQLDEALEYYTVIKDQKISKPIKLMILRNMKDIESAIVDSYVKQKGILQKFK